MANKLTASNGFDAGRPGKDLIPVTPDDDNDLPILARAIRCVEVGVVVVITESNTERVWTLFNQGEVILCGVKRVKAASSDLPPIATTATVEAYIN